MFDAYTIKKVMPRLVAAVILIQLSWPLFTGAITMVNQIAWGIEGIMYMPFGGRDAVSLSNSLASVAGTGEIVGLIGGGMLWIGFSAIGGMAIAIAILTAIAAAYFTLIVRQVIIILLVLTGPIALVAWILPNTEKLWKLWWGTFSKALLMYPLVLMLVAAGRITAHITSQAYGPGSGGGDFTATVMVLILFFAPFFLLPKTFAFAGGAIAGVSGAIASRGAKLRGMSNKRAMAKLGKTWGGRKQKFQAGGYGSDRNKFTRGIRRAGQMSGQSVWTGFGTTKKGRANMALETGQHANELLKDGRFVEATFDDGARLALQYGSEDAARNAVASSRANYATEADYQAAVKRGEAIGPISEKSFAKAKAVGYNKNTQLAAIKAEASNKGRNYKGLAGIDALNERINTVAQATGVDAEDLRSDVSYGMRTSGGRYDLGKLSSSETAAQQALNGWQTGTLYDHSARGTADSFDTVADAARATGGETLAVFNEEAKQVHSNATGAVADRANEFTNDTATQAAVKNYYNSGGFVPGRVTTKTSYIPDGAGGYEQVETPISTALDSSLERQAKSKARGFERPNPNDIP